MRKHAQKGGAGMSTIEITSKNFRRKVLKSTKTILVDFWAPWCLPCRMLTPILEDAAKELGSTFVVGRINVDEEFELALSLGVTSVPTILVIQKGKVLGVNVGLLTKESLIALATSAQALAPPLDKPKRRRYNKRIKTEIKTEDRE